MSATVVNTPDKVASFDDEKGELEQVNVLFSFLEDRYMKRVCLFAMDPFLYCLKGGYFSMSMLSSLSSSLFGNDD